MRFPPSPPIFKIRILGDCCLALATLGLGFRRDFEEKFEIQKQIVKKLDELSAQTKKLEVAYRQKIDDLEELKKLF